MQEATQSERKFLKLLNVLAKLCNFELDSTTLGLYDKHLSPLGYEQVSYALEQLFTKRGSRDPFPSISKIKEEMGESISDKSIAENAANTIIKAFLDNGYAWPWGSCGDYEAMVGGKRLIFKSFREAYIAECGELCWAITGKMGGYAALVEEWRVIKNQQNFRAQIREMAKSCLELARAGRLDVPQQLPMSNRDQKSETLKIGQLVENQKLFD